MARPESPVYHEIALTPIRHANIGAFREKNIECQGVISGGQRRDSNAGPDRKDVMAPGTAPRVG
jgi:hypothetical protein